MGCVMHQAAEAPEPYIQEVHVPLHFWEWSIIFTSCIFSQPNNTDDDDDSKDVGLGQRINFEIILQLQRLK